MEKNIPQNSNAEIKLEDVLSLDIPQMMILFFLSSQITETVRFTLLQDLNKYIFPDAKLSSSSFYHTLDKLEKFGYLEIKKSKTGRTKSILGKPVIKNVLQIISQYTTIFSLDTDLMIEDFITNLAELNNKEKFSNLLLIDIDEFFDFGTTALLKKYTKELFILTDDETFERYRNRGVQEIHQSQIINGKIREPDKIFDVVFIMDFKKTSNFYGIDERTVLIEATRVTKENGLIIIIGMDELPETNNFFLDSVAQKVKSHPLFNPIKNDDFLKLISSVSPVQPEFISKKGVLIAKIKI